MYSLHYLCINVEFIELIKIMALLTCCLVSPLKHRGWVQMAKYQRMWWAEDRRGSPKNVPRATSWKSLLKIFNTAYFSVKSHVSPLKHSHNT